MVPVTLNNDVVDVSSMRVDVTSDGWLLSWRFVLSMSAQEPTHLTSQDGPIAVSFYPKLVEWGELPLDLQHWRELPVRAHGAAFLESISLDDDICLYGFTGTGAIRFGSGS